MSIRIILRRTSLKALIVTFILLVSMISHPYLISADEGEILFHSFDEEGSPWICSINADKTGFKKIIKNGLWPVWSSNRKMFAFFALQERGEGSESIRWTVSISDGNGKILYAIKPLKTRIIESNFPSYCEWSPDGKKLAITTAARSHVYVRIFHIETGQVQEVYADPVDDFDTAFLLSSIEWLDNTKLLFISGSPEISDGTHIIDLAENRVRTWKKVGTFLNYSIRKGILGVLHTDTKTVFELLDDEGNVTDKVGSLDDKYLPVSSMQGHNLVLLLILQQSTFDSPLSKIYLLNVSTMEMEEINTVPSDRHRLFDPTFSPDGKKMIYALHTMYDTNGEYSKSYYIYDVATKKSTLLKSFKQATGDDPMNFFVMFGGKQREFSWK